MLPHGLIGVIHLRPLPGDPGYRGGGFAGALSAALADARTWAEAGAQALLVENFGSAPFSKGDARNPTPLPQVLAIALAAAEIRSLGLPIGINVLRNDGHAAMAAAAAVGAQFIRVNVLAGAFLTDQGVIEGEADRIARLRAVLDPNVSVLADIRVKHATPLVPRDLRDEVDELVGRAGADAVLITGRGTGHAPDPDLVAQVGSARADLPVYLASGYQPALAETVAPRVHGAIVGTWAKRDGQVANPVDPDRARALVEASRGRFRPLPPSRQPT